MRLRPPAIENLSCLGLYSVEIRNQLQRISNQFSSEAAHHILQQTQQTVKNPRKGSPGGNGARREFRDNDTEQARQHTHGSDIDSQDQVGWKQPPQLIRPLVRQHKNEHGREENRLRNQPCQHIGKSQFAVIAPLGHFPYPYQMTCATLIFVGYCAQARDHSQHTVDGVYNSEHNGTQYLVIRDGHTVYGQCTRPRSKEQKHQNADGRDDI